MAAKKPLGLELVETPQGVVGRHSLTSLDYLRVVSAFGVVWFHMRDEWDRSIGYAGLFSFAMLASFLASRSVRRRDFSDYAKDRFLRLIIPWLFWSVFYLALRLFLSSTLSVRRPWDVVEPGMIIGGGHIVLWYLSFMYIASMIIYGLMAFTRDCSVSWLSVSYLFFSQCLAAMTPFVSVVVSTLYPIAQWLAISPAILLGLSAGCILEIDSKSKRQRIFSLMAISVFAVTVYRCSLGMDLGALSLCIGALGTIAALLIQLPKSRTVKVLSDLTLGIYVLHPCVAKFLEISRWQFPFPLDVIIVFSTSALLVAALREVRLFRRFL